MQYSVLAENNTDTPWPADAVNALCENSGRRGRLGSVHPALETLGDCLHRQNRSKRLARTGLTDSVDACSDCNIQSGRLRLKQQLAVCITQMPKH